MQASFMFRLSGLQATTHSNRRTLGQLRRYLSENLHPMNDLATDSAEVLVPYGAEASGVGLKQSG